MAGPLGSGVLDAFDTDGALSASWTPRPIVAGITNTTGPVISGGIAVSPTVATDYYGAWWNAATFDGNHEVWAPVQPGREHIQLYLCLADPGVNDGVDGYKLDYDFSSGDDTLRLYRMDNEVDTQLGSDITQEIADGDALALYRKSPTTVAVGYRATGSETWSEIATAEDATYTSGYIGFAVDWESSTPSPGLYEFGGGVEVLPDPNVFLHNGTEFVPATMKVQS